MRRRAGRDVWRGWLVHQVESFELTTPSTLPVGDSTDMGYSQSELLFNLFVSTCSCAPRVFRRASQGPQGAGPCSYRVVPFGGGGALQGPDRRLRTAVSSADRAESLGL